MDRPPKDASKFTSSEEYRLDALVDACTSNSPWMEEENPSPDVMAFSFDDEGFDRVARELLEDFPDLPSSAVSKEQLKREIVRLTEYYRAWQYIIRHWPSAVEEDANRRFRYRRIHPTDSQLSKRVKKSFPDFRGDYSLLEMFFKSETLGQTMRKLQIILGDSDFELEEFEKDPGLVRQRMKMHNKMKERVARKKSAVIQNDPDREATRQHFKEMMEREWVRREGDATRALNSLHTEQMIDDSTFEKFLPLLERHCSFVVSVLSAKELLPEEKVETLQSRGFYEQCVKYTD